MNTKIKHEMTSKKEKIKVLFGVIQLDATGRFDFTSFSRSTSRSKYWFKTKTLVVASEKAKKTVAVISNVDTPKRTLPKPKLKIHQANSQPSQPQNIETFYAFQNEVKVRNLRVLPPFALDIFGFPMMESINPLNAIR